tara:strand:+ start:694 stop:1569 length:876 start_codon:yes stop_codon:yes gene_type:complete
MINNAQISAKADTERQPDGDSTKLKTYAVHIRLDYPVSAPRTATTRMIDDKFVWYRLYQTKGRGNAVVQAQQWFLDLRYDGARKKGSVGKVLQGKEAYECVVVDDPWNECSYGSEFNPIRPVNRLLDEETKKRVIEESKGNLKLADSPFRKGQSYPSLEWIEGAKKVDDTPIKIGFNTTVDPSREGMRDSLNKAVERAKTRRKNKELPWLKEVENEDARRVVREMRKSGAIEHSSVFRKRIKTTKSKLRAASAATKWKSKNLANAKAKNAQGEMKNADDTKGIGEYNRKVA